MSKSQLKDKNFLITEIKEFLKELEGDVKKLNVRGEEGTITRLKHISSGDLYLVFLDNEEETQLEHLSRKDLENVYDKLLSKLM